MSNEKYIILTNDNRAEIKNEMNRLNGDGYRCAHFQVLDEFYDGTATPHHKVNYYALMSYVDPSKYADIEAFCKVPINDRWQTVQEGVDIIHHTSKEFILVRRKKKDGKQPSG